ncbi:MAG: Tfp pilus assembly protein PilF/peroxiredoxin [Planctomycetota bacterium]
MPSHSPSGETLTLDYADGWAAVNRLIRQGESWSGREMDCAYWNAGDGTYVDVSNTLGLAKLGDGRGFVQVDWDGDGDLDLWLSNRTAPQVQYLRNNSAQGGFLRLQLKGAGNNTDAIGARVEVRIPENRFRLDRRLGSGYLSQSSEWLHFGLGDAKKIDGVTVLWPNGDRQEFRDLVIGGRYTLKQGQADALPLAHVARAIFLNGEEPQALKTPSVSRTAIAKRLAVPGIEVQTFDGRSITLGEQSSGRPRLVNFWASWCANCMVELRAWQAAPGTFDELGLDVLALSVDEDPELARSAWSRLKLPFDAAVAPERAIAVFDVLQRMIVDRQREMAVPTSFLLDAEGRIAVIYRGPVEAETLADDVRALDETAAFVGLPFPGRAFGESKAMPLFKITQRMLDQGRPQDALFYINASCDQLGPPESHPEDAGRLSDSLTRTGMYFLSEQDFEQARESFKLAVAYSPKDPLAWFGQARLCSAQADTAGAVAALEKTIAIDPSFAPAWELLGNSKFLLQDLDAARSALERATAINPAIAQAWTTLGIVELSSERFAEGAQAFGKAAELAPRTVNAWTGLAMCRLQLGEIAGAKQALENALQLDPQNARALGIQSQLKNR